MNDLRIKRANKINRSPGAFNSVGDYELNRDSRATACIYGWANRLAGSLGEICCRLLLNAVAD